MASWKMTRLSVVALAIGFVLLVGACIAYAIECSLDEVVVISERPNGTRRVRCLSQEAADKLNDKNVVIVLPSGCPCWRGREVEVFDELLALIDEYQATPENEVAEWTCRFTDDVFPGATYPFIDITQQLIFTDGTRHERRVSAIKSLIGPNQAHPGYQCIDYHTTRNNELWQRRGFHGLFDAEYTRCAAYIDSLRDICADVQ